MDLLYGLEAVGIGISGVVLAILWHEAGHYGAAWACGHQPRAVLTLRPLRIGVAIETSFTPLQAAVSYAAGPVANLVGIGLLSLAPLTRLTAGYMGANLVLAVGALFYPSPRSDGAQVVAALRAWLRGQKEA